MAKPPTFQFLDSPNDSPNDSPMMILMVSHLLHRQLPIETPKRRVRLGAPLMPLRFRSSSGGSGAPSEPGNGPSSIFS